jgi:Protein of unknown function (DUF2795)
VSMFGGLGDKIKGLAGDEIMKYVKGLNFPANKQDVEGAFKKNNAPTEMLSALGRLPEMKFNSAQDLINAIKGKF